MPVAMDDIAVGYEQAGSGHMVAEIDDLHPGMTGAQRCGQTLELRVHRVEITHGAVGYCADATQAPVDMRVHFTPERTQSRLTVDVLDYRNRGLLRLRQIFVVGELIFSAHRRIVRRGGTDRHRPGEADDRRQLRKRCDQRLPRESGASALPAGHFQPVGDGGRVEAAQMFEQRACVHLNPPSMVYSELSAFAARLVLPQPPQPMGSKSGGAMLHTGDVMDD